MIIIVIIEKLNINKVNNNNMKIDKIHKIKTGNSKETHLGRYNGPVHT